MSHSSGSHHSRHVDRPNDTCMLPVLQPLKQATPEPCSKLPTNSWTHARHGSAVSCTQQAGRCSKSGSLAHGRRCTAQHDSGTVPRSGVVRAVPDTLAKCKGQCRERSKPSGSAATANDQLLNLHIPDTLAKSKGQCRERRKPSGSAATANDQLLNLHIPARPTSNAADAYSLFLVHTVFWETRNNSTDLHQQDTPDVSTKVSTSPTQQPGKRLKQQPVHVALSVNPDAAQVRILMSNTSKCDAMCCIDTSYHLKHTMQPH